MTTWTPVDGTIVLDEKGQRYVYRDGEWKPAPEWKDEPSPLDDRRVEPEPITVEWLEAAGWYAKEYGNGCVGYMQHGVIVHFDPTLDGPLVTWRGEKIPGCRTMQQLRALVEILGG